MSETPRTDSAWTADNLTVPLRCVLPLRDLSRELEIELADVRAELHKLRIRILSDALVMSCQTITQYRAALLAREQEPPR